LISCNHYCLKLAIQQHNEVCHQLGVVKPIERSWWSVTGIKLPPSQTVYCGGVDMNSLQQSILLQAEEALSNRKRSGIECFLQEARCPQGA
jgi:hypothetical protein